MNDRAATVASGSDKVAGTGGGGPLSAGLWAMAGRPAIPARIINDNSRARQAINERQVRGMRFPAMFAQKSKRAIEKTFKGRRFMN
jgi:hypothetical protein